MDDIRTWNGLLNQSDAARFLSIPQQTFNHWAHGYERGRPLLHILPQPAEHRMATLPFVAMAEAYVLGALRAAGVKPRKIRPALERLQREIGQYVLVAPELATHGTDVLWDFSKTSSEGEGLLDDSTGYRQIREIVTACLQSIVRAEDGYPAMLHLRHWAPSKIVIDPLRAFGQPIFEESRTRVADVAAMVRAGEDFEVIADELGSPSKTSEPPPASLWATPPEFYLDENSVSRTIRNCSPDLDIASTVLPNCMGQGIRRWGPMMTTGCRR
ncbi:DUF433 domain-containing protein [Nonomuraea jabiensis]|uniref:DUF433 domain-containing protein n=1 Tax=Nonomuraea jabiensis TaxID=882448 RepID=UPI00343B8DF5